MVSDEQVELYGGADAWSPWPYEVLNAKEKDIPKDNLYGILEHIEH